MRDVAFTALLSRCGWFGDLKMSDGDAVVTKFLQDWREAQYRHDTEGRTLFQFAVTWADATREAYKKTYPYLAV
jgi:hypothetical protein